MSGEFRLQSGRASVFIGSVTGDSQGKLGSLCPTPIPWLVSGLGSHTEKDPPIAQVDRRRLESRFQFYKGGTAMKRGLRA